MLRVISLVACLSIGVDAAIKEAPIAYLTPASLASVISEQIKAPLRRGDSVRANEIAKVNAIEILESITHPNDEEQVLKDNIRELLVESREFRSANPDVFHSTKLDMFTLAISRKASELTKINSQRQLAHRKLGKLDEHSEDDIEDEDLYN